VGRAPERATHQCNHSIFDVFRRERHLDSSPTDDVTESPSSLSEASLGDTEVVYATWVCEDTVRYCLRFAPSLVRIHGKCQDAAVSYSLPDMGCRVDIDVVFLISPGALRRLQNLLRSN
jgi:hypothetical protein